MEFDTIGLQGKFRDLIGDPSVGFSCMVYGKPKSGKSTLCIDFAKHLAEHHGKVLYCAIEEGYGYTLKEKLERLNAVHDNLFISRNIPDNLSDYQFVFIDSVSKGKVSNEKLNELIKTHPGTAFIFIFHSTKEGSFRGGQENAHDVDVIIEVEDGVANSQGRFNSSGKQIDIFKEYLNIGNYRYCSENERNNYLPLNGKKSLGMEESIQFEIQDDGQIKVDYSTGKYGQDFEISGTLVKRFDGRKTFYGLEPDGVMPDNESVWDENWEEIEEYVIDKFYEWEKNETKNNSNR